MSFIHFIIAHGLAEFVIYFFKFFEQVYDVLASFHHDFFGRL